MRLRLLLVVVRLARCDVTAGAGAGEAVVRCAVRDVRLRERIAAAVLLRRVLLLLLLVGIVGRLLLVALVVGLLLLLLVWVLGLAAVTIAWMSA